MSIFRLYTPAEDVFAPDGYPAAWATIKHTVRQQAGHRCIRCHHPYSQGQGEWSPCDSRCTHNALGTRQVRGEPIRVGGMGTYIPHGNPSHGPAMTEAQWRILTVHHLDQDKANCRWWNLTALCQRCHLSIQGRVHMARVWPWEHTEWFQPYVAGYYAWCYLGEDLSRHHVMERLDELLSLERIDRLGIAR